MGKPLISVVVPVYNGAEFIGTCIESLLAMAYPPDKLEIIIVDNRSTDNTCDIIRQYPVIAAAEPIQGSSAARNTGIQMARGDIIAFTDADCRVERQWAQEIDTTFRDGRIDAALGFAAGINKNIHAAFAQKRWEESWFHKSPSGCTLKHKGIDTRNCAIRKRILETYGYFDPDIKYCADLEMSIRLNSNKCHIVFNPHMKVWHKNPTSFREILDKSRKQLPFVLHLRRHFPEGSRWEDVPFPDSAFFGIAQHNFSGATLAMVLLLLRLARGVVFATTQLCLTLRLRHAWVFKLYKVFFGMSYDMAILRAKRHGPWR